ncbi:hypothetical protein ACWFMI_23710 [Nocardiopsis terrae]|uniref:hypothetical protein n=1 Tax=Streptomyces sp. NPDC057554 TaxID=3350538 RepID=UPI00368433E8
MDHEPIYDGPPVGAHRYPTPEDPKLNWRQPPPTPERIVALDGQPVRLTMVARDDVDEDVRVYDNVLLQHLPDEVCFDLMVTQLLIPSTEWGFAAMASELDGIHRTSEVIDITPTERLYPVRRTYTPGELHRYVGHGAELAIIRAQPDKPIETGQVLRPMVIDMDGPDATTVRLSKVISWRKDEHGRDEPHDVRPMKNPVPIEEIAFAMQINEFVLL